MKVIAGKYKGRVLPFVNKRFNNADSTPQKLKGSLFSVLGENFKGKLFLDLYACSGQIGIEALSREAEMVVFNEIEKKRFYFIRSLINDWDLGDSGIVYNFHAERCLRHLKSKNILFDYIYIDPPYKKVKGDVNLYNNILNNISKKSILKNYGVIVIQHFSKNVLRERIYNYYLIERKKYSNNTLSFYRSDID